VWCAGAVPMLIEIVKEGSSAVQSAVVALEKLCSHSSGKPACCDDITASSSQLLRHNFLVTTSSSQFHRHKCLLRRHHNFFITTSFITNACCDAISTSSSQLLHQNFLVATSSSRLLHRKCLLRHHHNFFITISSSQMPAAAPSQVLSYNFFVTACCKCWCLGADITHACSAAVVDCFCTIFAPDVPHTE